MKEVLVRPIRADVAKEAEVTETIVSYVINDNRYVDSLASSHAGVGIDTSDFRIVVILTQ